MSTLESFCNLVWGTSYFKVTQKISKNDYKEFQIPKKGGMRTINYLDKNSPLGELQHQLLLNYLWKHDLPVCVKGFRKGESYRSFLSDHIGSEFFLRIDISSFFPSISDTLIKTEFSNLVTCSIAEEKAKILDLICDIVTLDNKLPQGACTSPMVSNIVMARIDQRITKYCQVFNIRYTRYADDLLFSSKEFNFSEKKWFIKKIKYILAAQKLKLNYGKQKMGRKEFALNGYIISDTGIRLSRNRLSDIRHSVTFSKNNYSLLETQGVIAFLNEANNLPLKYRDLKRYPFSTVFQFVQYLCGYRSFLISLTDENYASSTFQKELQRLIRRIEKEIIRLSKANSVAIRKSC